MRAEFLGGPRDGLIADVDVPPSPRLRVPVRRGALDENGLPTNDVAIYILVEEGEELLTYAHRPGEQA